MKYICHVCGTTFNRQSNKGLLKHLDDTCPNCVQELEEEELKQDIFYNKQEPYA